MQSLTESITESSRENKSFMRLVDFEIIKIIGRGGFGKVFLVRNK
jgi:serine/threonine protein kinase